MKITPTSNYLLISLERLPSESSILRPDGAEGMPYGLVLDAGPDCKTTKVGDCIMFLPDNMIGGFVAGLNQHIVPESAIFAYVQDL